MTDNFDRTDIIRYRLDKHVLEDLQVAVATMDLDAWAEFAAEHDQDTRFGWTAPCEWDGIITVPYCPEAISVLTDTLSDNDFIVFMDTLEWMIDKHIALGETPYEERRRMIEDELYDLNPDVLAFFSNLELSFLGGT